MRAPTLPPRVEVPNAKSGMQQFAALYVREHPDLSGAGSYWRRVTMWVRVLRSGALANRSRSGWRSRLSEHLRDRQRRSARCVRQGFFASFAFGPMSDGVRRAGFITTWMIHMQKIVSASWHRQ